MSVKQGGNTIAGGGTVDQTYDGTSANAQSGTAVAGAISNMVTTDTAQTISGQKTFAGNNTLFTNDGESGNDIHIIMNYPNSVKGESVSNNEYYEILAQDKDGGSADSNRYGNLSFAKRTDGSVQAIIAAYRNVANSTAAARIIVQIADDGTISTSAPAVTNTNGIVTQTALTKATNGYLKLGNGIIIQWGDHSTTSTGASTITFPTAFSDNNYSIVFTRISGSSTTNESGSYYFRGRTTTNVAVYKTSNNTQAMMWIAIGY